MLHTLRGLLSTSRPATSLLFTVVGSFLLYLIGIEPEKILPIFLLSTILSFITFTINDLFDAEQDKVNHPRRFLVINPSAKRVTTVYYLVLVGTYCVLSTEALNWKYSWIFVILLIVFVNYSIVKANVPIAKNVYISLASVGFCLAVLEYFNFVQAPAITLSAVVFMLAREILMDMPDTEGDQDSIAKRLGHRKSIRCIIALSGAAATILTIDLWHSRPFLVPIGYLFPVLLIIRARSIAGSSVDQFSRVTTGLPYVYCAYLAISS